MNTKYKRVVLSRIGRVQLKGDLWGGDARVRPTAGKSAMKRVLDAMNAGHRVEMRTYYEGTDELMDAEIFPIEPD